ncbi:GNAT family N-acetyltransferase [Flavivirga rizhaonensis]|uniref:N-acetyltransferase family protein n=1 Tax=Flavivirga rizhaonensis TaxID=2559571 RepID=A0A4S1E246_9FLAO|nr:GNAT family N-acetyltransferase [Flavivirga rizhaonensis]TGV04455.1 N-acetyltransferase family protein [Flavivirga rizhaonensis]
MIRHLNLNDTEELLDIYNYYVLNSIVTFDDVALSLETFKDKITRINKDYPFIVFEENNEILGYAYGSKWRPKPAYKHTVESTVYVKHSVLGKQIGTKLYTALLSQLKEQNYHIVLGGLTLPNDASVKLHEKFGFNQVAHFKEVGLKFGKWLDVGFWQLRF